MAEPESESVFAVPRLEKLTPETDQFGHLDYAATIARVLREADPPFTLGLYGPWGVGKTLVIGAACEAVSDEFAFAIYDAWRYDGDTLRRHFLRDVAKSLETAGELQDYKVDDKLKDLDIETVEPKDTGPAIDWKYFKLLVFALVVIGGLIALFVWAFVDAHRLWAWLIGIGGGLLVLLVSSLVSPFARVIKIAQVSEVRQRVVDPEVFAAKFEELLRHVKKKRLVVAIDNLDRCSPHRVTELLETLNTYLEPAGNSETGADAVFVVAADDDALKRHIESQEAKRSEGLDDFARVDVGRYADEYLRKIFTATIPIKPALSTELKAYVATQVEVLARLRGVKDQNLTSLIAVIAEGLRRNPRRVSQFIKNLELRLLLLKRRFESTKKMMAADLSTPANVPFVAKLLLLEEEYPDAYAALARDRTLLEKWHQEQAAQLSSDAPSRAHFRFTGLQNERWTEEQTRQFATFLGGTRQVRSQQLSAFLSLKQSKYEVELPLWADFRDALLESDRDGLAAITAELAPADLALYADTLRELANDNSGYPDTIRVIVETAVNDDTLRSQAPMKLAELVGWALNDPAREAGLRTIAPERILPLAEQLDAADFNKVVGLFLTGEDLEIFVAPPVDALVALDASAPERLEPKTKDLLQRSLVVDAMTTRAAEIVKVLNWWPEAASVELARGSVQRLATGEGVLPATPEIKIIITCLGNVWHGTGGAERDQILNAVRARVAYLYGPSPVEVDERVATITELVSLTRALKDAGGSPGPDRNSLIKEINDEVGQVRPRFDDARDVAPILNLIGEVALLGDDPTSQPRIKNLVAHFRAQNQAALSAYAVDHGKGIPEPVVVELIPALAELVAGNDAQALAGLVAILGSDNDDVLGPALEEAAAAERFEFIDAALRSHPSELTKYLGRTATRALEVGSHDGLRFALANSKALDKDSQERLAEALGQDLIAIAGTAEAEKVIDDVETSVISNRIPSIVAQLWEHAKSQSPPPFELLSLIAPRRKQLSATNQSAFVDGIEDWLRNGAGAPLIDALDEAELRSKERERFVKAIIAYQASGAVASSDLDLRETSFTLAKRVAAASTPANAALIGAISDLEKGSPDDQQLNQRLTATEGTSGLEPAN